MTKILHKVSANLTLGLTKTETHSSDSDGQGNHAHDSNTFPSHRENYFKKLFFYVFGEFCSVLWIGVILFFICWRLLGDHNPAAYNLGLAILVLIVIFLPALFSAFQDWSTALTMKSILDLLRADAVVLRDGNCARLLWSIL
jgi:sodium/potassium-transporting ATPase subunit alpha